MDPEFSGKGLNRYASDRIAVSDGTLTVDVLEGGSVAPGGPLPDGLGYKCNSAQEHVPLRAFITDSRIPSIQTGASLRASTSFYVLGVAVLLSSVKVF